ncbi:hypothetical protein BMS3Abin07_00427 [bacterium BMS3Abin07]|nr:hypothetical protein BMS3Abin07_00427 [bacterium BMS3Abin07]GBE32762.1 hypothetical protein BMS3Bbin05_01681 [bacterium BMS3Bbin05]HDL19879.1 glycine zipper family protein [Nitrospirota bacterium]HDO22387.1 glycine zipper family protein [Nitrospirota bacterium]HDZ87823.1 glycine zipper family protein [Nitrospirota bacterium]
MVKKTVIVTMLLMFAFQTSAFAAVETQGDVVFRDALYGTAIGAIIGGAIYLVNQEDFATKVGVGVAVGTIGGLFFGVQESRSLAEIKGKNVKFALPTPVIQKRGNSIIYSTSLLRIHTD